MQFSAFYTRIAALTYVLCLTVMLLFVLVMPLLGGEAMRLAREGVSRNADWQPVVGLSVGGVEMVLVPAGCFTMGSTDEQVDHYISRDYGRDQFTIEQPAHQQCFTEPFWIDRYEVSNEQFARLGGVAGQESRQTGANRPREMITWFEAQDFCKIRGARLPTEVEWEYAARGPDSLVYPWGDEFVVDNVVYYDYDFGDETDDVGSKPEGMSWVGAYNLSGNVWEWTNTIYRDYTYDASDGREDNSDASSERVLRGGSWYSTFNNYFRAAVRILNYPYFRLNHGGFRCVRLQ